MDSFLNIYNEKLSNVKNNNNIELEITYHILKSQNIYKEIFDKLKEFSNSIDIIENIDIYYNDNVRVTKTFKHGVNTNNDIITKKTSLLKPFRFSSNINNITNYKLKLNNEEQLKSASLGSIKFIRIKLRLSFIFQNNDKFKVDFDLIKNIDANEKHIKEIKNMLFKGYSIDNITENINYSLFDEIVLETEFMNNKKDPITKDDIDTSIDFIKSLFSSNIGEYQKYIYKIAQKIINNSVYRENFKEKFGLKKLLNNVLEVNSESYYKNIIPNIENYYVTDKIDGQRCICVIEEYDTLVNIKLMTNKLYQIKEYSDKIVIIKDASNTTRKKTTILDCEIIFNNAKAKELDEISDSDIFLYIFDILSLENDKIAFEPFENRIKELENGFNKVKMLKNVNVKEYKKLTSEYKSELKDFYEKKSLNKTYEIDGLIFIPNSNVQNKDTKFKMNTNYSNMVGYKWKPIEHMTIDFFVCKLPKNMYTNIPYNNYKLKSNEFIYILFSGISKSDYEKFKLSYMVDYKKIINEKYMNGNMFPIQFTTSDNIYNYIYIGSENELDNRICEFGYDLNKHSWKFKKIRSDRDVELERGDYFGNYYTISEYIWNNINNPLTFDMLIGDNSSYFINDENDFYKAQRSFNSFVKTFALESIISEQLNDKNQTDFVIDLASGKGQDLARLSNLDFKSGLFIDNDKNALSELLNRKHHLKTRNNKQMQIFIKNIDLKTNYLEIIKTINELNIKKESADIIICNFAIHYIIINDDYLTNFIKLLDYYLKPNGRFIFTCFDGQRVFNLLKDTEIWNSYENNNLKFSIKKLFKSENLANNGQKIDVLLPFSNNEYYTEYLVNLDYVSNVFNQSNFTTEISLSFSTLLDEFKNRNSKVYNNLSKSDKEFINLYQYVIIKKNQSNSIISRSNINKIYKDITGGDESNENKAISHGNLEHINNFPNCNRILVIINTDIKNILDNIISIFEENNYKNFYKYKKNKNNIVKVVGFKNDENSYKIIFSENQNFDSVILYDKSFIYTEFFNNILIKKSSIPIILSDNNNNIIIINKELLNKIYENESNLSYDNDSNDNENIQSYIKLNDIFYIHN